MSFVFVFGLVLIYRCWTRTCFVLAYECVWCKIYCKCCLGKAFGIVYMLVDTRNTANDEENAGVTHWKIILSAQESFPLWRQHFLLNSLLQY